MKKHLTKECKGDCGGSVGRAVASDPRGLRFKSSHSQKFTVNCIEKTKIKKKRPGKAHLKKRNVTEADLTKSMDRQHLK